MELIGIQIVHRGPHRVRSKPRGRHQFPFIEGQTPSRHRVGKLAAIIVFPFDGVVGRGSALLAGIRLNGGIVEANRLVKKLREPGLDAPGKFVGGPRGRLIPHAERQPGHGTGRAVPDGVVEGAQVVAGLVYQGAVVGI